METKPTVTEEQLKTLDKVVAGVRRHNGDYHASRDARTLAPFVFDDIADLIVAYRELQKQCNSPTT